MSNPIIRLDELEHYTRNVILPLAEDVSEIKNSGASEVKLIVENGTLYAEYEEGE